ncbi:MAG: HIT domain-containing protein [Patescibacteria group bacterium]
MPVENRRRSLWFKVSLSIGVLLAGVVLGAYLFRDTQPRSFLAIDQCQSNCLSRKELLGLLGSVGVQKAGWTIPNVVLETPLNVAITHPLPTAPIHYVIIPKKDIRNIGELSPEDQTYVMDAYAVAQQLIEQDKLEKYKFSTLGPGWQDVAYLHFHLTAEK